MQDFEIAFLIMVGMIIFLLLLNVYSDKKLGRKILENNSLKSNIAILNQNNILISKNNEQLKKRIRDLEEQCNALSTEKKDFKARINFLDAIYHELNSSVVQGRQWLLDLINEAITAKDNATVEVLKTKKNPAIKAAEKLSEIQAERRRLIVENRHLLYQLKLYEEYFPTIEDYKDEILAGKPSVEDFSVDPARRFLSESEYSNLSSAEKNQLALNRYLNSKHLSKREIGRIYERFIGYLFESKGYTVEYTGIEKGFEDLGQDLICKKDGSVVIVQAKYWSTQKLIREKHIIQLKGSTVLHQIENPSANLLEPDYRCLLVTSTKLSDLAKSVAKKLGVEYREEFALDKTYPMIKCNINRHTGEKIYHLPFDQMYDKVKIDADGEFYALTTEEAEAKGFRRAFKYRGV